MTKHMYYVIQSGAMKLVLWRHWMHVTQVHPVTTEYQFHCTRLYCSVACIIVQLKKEATMLPNQSFWKRTHSDSSYGSCSKCKTILYRFKCTAWSCEIGSLTSVDAPELYAPSDDREPSSLHVVARHYTTSCLLSKKFNGKEHGKKLLHACTSTCRSHISCFELSWDQSHQSHFTVLQHVQCHTQL